MSKHNFTNQQVTKLLRSVAAALTLKRGLPDGKQANIFEIRAYEYAADSIQHLTAEVKDLWEEGKLDQVSGIGKSLMSYLDELFKSGKVKHFEEITKGIKPVVFDLLDIPGVGPKTALELSKLGIKSLDDLKGQIHSGELAKKGFSKKTALKINLGLKELSGRSGRMLLPYATTQAQKILEYLKKAPGAEVANPLGSLRRQVATIGDLDFAAASNKPREIVNYFVKMPGVVRVVEQGENQATVILSSGLQGDLLVGKPESYGALLQHFTGSKAHNIKLRLLAKQKGFSLSEYGVGKIKNQKSKVKSEEVLQCKTEKELYELLAMDVPPPELREDTGEIELALNHKLPKLVEPKDIKGDLHLHSNFPLEPSHDSGVNSIEEIVNKASELGYQYVGISDHSPGFTTHTKEQIIKLIEKRTKFIQDLNKSKKDIRVLNGLEIDILGDGSLSVPDEALETLDYSIAGIHSGHRGSKEIITKRILKALENLHVDILAHPTGRLLNERGSYEADWEAVVKLAAKNKKFLEINAHPRRLDLRDDLVRMALKFGVKFMIDTDAHEISQMNNMPYGVSVARRGWAEKEDIVNSWDWTRFSKWFNIH